MNSKRLSANDCDLSPSDIHKIYQYMLRIRRFEEMALIKAQSGDFLNYHGSIGQEGIAVGATYALTPDDGTMITHRGLGVLIARGLTIKDTFAGLYGLENSPTRGRVPICHMGDPSLGILAGTSIVGSTIPLAVGVALSHKLDNSSNVVICFFGDGATNRGDFHEAFNLASIWNLPIIFFCVNNKVAKSTSIQKSTAGSSLLERASGYGIRSIFVDGADALDVYKTSNEAISHARSGCGPVFIECAAERWTPHSIAGEKEYAINELSAGMRMRKCPLVKLEKYLLDANIASSNDLRKDDLDARNEVVEAIQYVTATKTHDPSIALQNVYTTPDCD